MAIERNRGLLLGIVSGLLAMIGFTEGTGVERVSKPLYRKVQRILRSAEAAARRLIIAAARDIVAEPTLKRPAPVARKTSGQSQDKSQGQKTHEGNAKRKRRMSFSLFDRPRRKDWGIRRGRKRRGIEPHVRVFDTTPDPRIPWFLRPQVPAPAVVPKKAGIIDDGMVSVVRLCRRILAVKHALEDIPGQARRYARWWAKPVEERRPRRASALRLGWPPGWRIRPTHEVDEILKDCHWLVRNSEPALDTS
ncbi:MAG: hypothetical protein JNM20_18415, partial [Rhizobiales bacterium]|nr:hypothetical protein [Hyphomicrobiales bacterium]